MSLLSQLVFYIGTGPVIIILLYNFCGVLRLVVCRPSSFLQLIFQAAPREDLTVYFPSLREQFKSDSGRSTNDLAADS